MNINIYRVRYHCMCLRLHLLPIEAGPLRLDLDRRHAHPRRLVPPVVEPPAPPAPPSPPEAAPWGLRPRPRPEVAVVASPPSGLLRGRLAVPGALLVPPARAPAPASPPAAHTAAAGPPLGLGRSLGVNEVESLLINLGQARQARAAAEACVWAVCCVGGEARDVFGLWCVGVESRGSDMACR